MNLSRFRYRRILPLILCAIIFVGLGIPHRTWAQDGSHAGLRINRLDAAKAPEIDAVVTVQDLAGNAVTDLQATDFQVVENGKPVRNLKVTREKVGLQLAIVIDASGNINQPGLTKNPNRMEEVREALKSMLLEQQWIDRTDRTDWVIVLVQEEKQNGFKVITTDQDYPSGWTNDYQLAFNAVYQYDSAPRKGDTPLFDAVFEAIARMSSAPPDISERGMQRALIVFSDGADTTSITGDNDPVARAKAANTVIHTVLLGRPANEKDANNLRRLATLTGGQTAQYNGPATLDAMMTAITAKRDQYHLHYWAPVAGSHELQIAAPAGRGNALVRGSVRYTDALQRPAAKITVDRNQIEISQAGEAPPINATLAISWPDGKPRSISEVIYFLDDTRFAVTKAPFDRFTFPAQKLAPGPHSIHATVRDEFDLIGESAPAAIELRQLQPLKVWLTKPAVGTTIRRELPFPRNLMFWIKDSEIEPLRQLVEAAWEPRDGRPRQVQTVEFLVDGQPFTPLASAPTLFDWDVSTLESGAHVLQVSIVDELGLSATSDPMPVTLIVKPPWRPTAEWLVVLAAALAALGLALYVFIRRPQIVTNVAERVVSRVKEITEPWRLKSGEQRAAVAFLTVEEGDNTYPKPIPLVSGSNTRVGRDPALVSVVLQDRSVSRLHARISEEQDGAFHVYDEGSSSGTYVNFTPIGLEGQVLLPNDIINLGRVRMRFTLAKQGSSMPGVKDPTEVVQIAPPQRSSTATFDSSVAASPGTDDSDGTQPYTGAPSGMGVRAEFQGGNEKDETEPFQPLGGQRR